jgi:hypothetical protein
MLAARKAQVKDENDDDDDDPPWRTKLSTGEESNVPDQAAPQSAVPQNEIENSTGEIDPRVQTVLRVFSGSIEQTDGADNEHQSF